MRFLIIPRPGPSDAELPSCDERDASFDPSLFAAYMKYNEEMARAGVLVASEGLNPAAAAVQVGTVGGRRAVIDGPFAETKELVGGFYLIDVSSREEAIRWALRCPVGKGHEVLEVRQLTELSDLPPHLRERIVAEAPTWSGARWKSR